MNPTLIMEIADLALELAENHMKKDEHQGATIPETLLQIIQKSLQAYRTHTGKAVQAALLKS